MSVEEKIRRAEEIYNRRNGKNYTYSYKSNEKKGPSIVNRMIKQIVMCCIIYSMFYVVTNKEYFLSSEFKCQVENIASKNEILNNMYNKANGYIEKYIDKEEKEETDKKENENVSHEDSSINTNLENNEENIGGAVDEAIIERKTQEQKDVDYIKESLSFIKPLDGRISSTFGWRTPTTVTVPKYHTGIDLAASTGTIIKSATDGEIILASSEGDYGNHYKIQINDIIIIYAHCSKLYLKEGDKVYQGQDIAEVGSTGNSTGPHLHFEIRREDRKIDPQLILDI